MNLGHLSRVALRRDVPAAALAPLLLPDDPSKRVGSGHRLLWTLFSDGEERRRDFLWREVGRGASGVTRTSFYVLSRRPPADAHGLFEIATRPFEPLLAAGDRLRFSLRANPVVTRKDPKTGRACRHDVVMDRLRAVPAGERGALRREAIEGAGRAWLEGRGQRSGFRLLEPERFLRIDGYQQLRLPRRDGELRFSVLDFEGLLEITDPAAFGDALARGFGKAKAFGCGLMLIRRV